MHRNRKAAGKASEDRKTNSSSSRSGNNAPKKSFKFSKPSRSSSARPSRPSREGAENNEDRPSFSKKRSFRPSKPSYRKPNKAKQTPSDPDSIRLNKYLAHSGICSRREADTYIEAGLVEVNGKVVTELGTKVKLSDHVKYGGHSVRPEKPVYLLLNKPKDYITTLNDPQGRKTVSLLIAGACKERVFPVGRLDRNTTGLLLLTNDGALAKKLTHPKHGVRKIYMVTLDKNVAAADLKKLEKGVQLEDGYVNVDVASYVGDGADKKIVGVELHSGKNRVIRRLFEALGYTVTKLDRTVFAGLTKKNVQRGKYRFLTGKEISQLKML